MTNFSLAIHGGAGTILKSQITPQQEKEYLLALESALSIGYEILKKNGTALEAVEATVTELEDCPLFNAGRGSVFDSTGKHEMEASIMDGGGLRSGAAVGIRRVKNPVRLARQILESGQFLFLNGPGAEKFASEFGIELVEPGYFHTDYRFQQWQEAVKNNKILLDHSGNNKFGTVGAVAMDRNGDLAAATSTGGLTNKKYGRLGDSAITGAGNYANNKTCAISCTGYGEYFIRSVAAYDVSCLMEYKHLSLAEAIDYFLNHKLTPLGGEGGMIGIDSQGEVVMNFNSEGMYRGKVESKDEKIKVAIFRE